MDGGEEAERDSLSDAAKKVIEGFKDTRPEFLGSTDKEASRDKNVGSSGGGGAADGLRSAEKLAAGNGLSQNASGLDGVREKENKAGGFYSGGGREINKKSRNPNKRYEKGWFKRVGPAGGILIAILLFCGFAFGSLSTQIVAWKENISSMFGQSSAVINKRSNYIMRTLLKTNRDTTSSSIFGTKFKIGSKLSKKLSEQGIDYIETTDANGKKIKLLVYEDADGGVIPIVASDSDVARANTLVGSEIDIDGKKVKINTDSITLNEAKAKNKNFSVDYDTATITFTGKIAGWFDNVADSMYERIIGKNARSQTDIDDPDEEKVDEMLLKNKSDGTEDSELFVTKEETDEDGKPTTRPAESGDEVADGKTYGDIESDNGRIKIGDMDTSSVANKLTAKAQKVAMVSSTVGCAVLRSIGAISATIGAVQTMNVINYASKYLEIADKIKAGDADEVTNMAMDNINEPVDTTAYDIDGNVVDLKNKSVASSAGFNAPFSSKNIINENDPSALYNNREYANKNALRNAMGGGVLSDVIGAVSSFGAGITAFKICNGIQAVSGIVDAASDVVAIFTAGIAKGVKEIIKGAIQGAAFSIAMVTITSIISAITPMVASWFAGTLANAFLGANGGYALLSGGQNILNTNLQMSTGRYADRENAIELGALTHEVEKQWAAYEQATKSPFDIGSKYTFLGSIVNAMMPIANLSSGSLVSVVAPMAELTKDSALALVNPITNATSDVSNFSASLASEDNCSYLSSVGVAGDFACNKYAGAYVDELNTMDPDTIYQNMESYDSFDGEYSDGNPKINTKSEYAKYIVACVSNDSQPGTMSSAVEGFIEKTTTTDNAVANGLINFGMNFVPFEGFLDTFDAVEQAENMKWNSGLACTGKTDDNSFNERVKNFSMYNLDQRVLYDMGVIENNSTVSFLEEYYKENPLDDSFEGRIARFSGMTKEEVSDTLALIDYYQYIANYNPAERYVFGAPELEVEDKLIFDNENTVAENTWVILLNQIGYADVRNRSFAI